jgi:hypothetical protein
MDKITFKKLGYVLVAESGWKKVEIVDKGYQFNITFFSQGDVLETTRVFTLNEAKEEARKYLRGWENTPEFTGKNNPK